MVIMVIRDPDRVLVEDHVNQFIQYLGEGDAERLCATPVYLNNQCASALARVKKLSLGTTDVVVIPDANCRRDRRKIKALAAKIGAVYLEGRLGPKTET